MREYLLIVDDQEINRDVLRLMFEDKYDILEACSGEECIQLAKEHGDKLIMVLLDLHMPGLT
ncbi:MAG: response regulator [Lachnospiraceae bacterium]|nr:response regulator [Lachnospiraceae bacterium]